MKILKAIKYLKYTAFNYRRELISLKDASKKSI